MNAMVHLVEFVVGVEIEHTVEEVVVEK